MSVWQGRSGGVSFRRACCFCLEKMSVRQESTVFRVVAMSGDFRHRQSPDFKSPARSLQDGMLSRRTYVSEHACASHGLISYS